MRFSSLRGRFLGAVMSSFAVLGVVGCASVPVEAPQSRIRQTFLMFRADTAFTADERAAIESAVDRIAVQTRGLVGVAIAFGLNPRADAGGNLLVRLPSTSPLAHGWLGYTRSYADGTARVYLVHDRLENTAAWAHVAMHELLHAAGLRDLPGASQSVMSAVAVPEWPLCLNEADMREFCRVYECSAEAMGWCANK